MALDRFAPGRRLRLAHLGKRLGARCYVALLSTISERSLQRGAGLADESSTLDGHLFRNGVGLLARRLRNPKGMQLCERRSRGSTVGLYTLRSCGFSGFPGVRHSIHILFRVALWGGLGMGLSACAQLQHKLELAAGDQQATVQKSGGYAGENIPIHYTAQPRLGNSWQGSVGKRGLARVIVQKNPAIVISPTPKPLWLQAYPNGYHPNQEAAKVALHKAHPFKIPEAWFDNGQKHAAKQPSVVQAATHANPWHCQPAHLPCGKARTDYWACKKQDLGTKGAGTIENVIKHCKGNLKESWGSITSQGGAH